MRQVAQTWLGPKSYHTSQRPSLQVVWESLAVSLKSTIFHTGGLHCHGKITSIKMGFARLPVVVVWRLVDMTCLCNQPECSCASEDNHSNLRGCKATLQMWRRNIGKFRLVMQKKREVIILRQFEPSLSLYLLLTDLVHLGAVMANRMTLTPTACGTFKLIFMHHVQ